MIDFVAPAHVPSDFLEPLVPVVQVVQVLQAQNPQLQIIEHIVETPESLYGQGTQIGENLGTAPVCQNEGCGDSGSGEGLVTSPNRTPGPPDT